MPDFEISATKTVEIVFHVQAKDEDAAYEAADKAIGDADLLSKLDGYEEIDESVEVHEANEI